MRYLFAIAALAMPLSHSTLEGHSIHAAVDAPQSQSPEKTEESKPRKPSFLEGLNQKLKSIDDATSGRKRTTIDLRGQKPGEGSAVKADPNAVLRPTPGLSRTTDIDEGTTKLDEKYGFRDFTFGMSLDAFTGKPVPDAFKKGLRRVQHPKDTLEIGRASATFIHYVFFNNKLARVEILIDKREGRDISGSKVYEALKGVYGRGLWAKQSERPYIDTLPDTYNAFGKGRGALLINPIKWEGKKVLMVLDGLAMGKSPEETALPPIVHPILLTIDALPLIEEMKGEKGQNEKERAKKPNL